MLKIIVDGSADMPDGWVEKFHLDILPMPIQIGNRTYYQGEDITPDLFYQLIKGKENHPTTAAPSPFRIVDFIEKVSEIGDKVLSINVSGKMSSTVSMVRKAALDLRGNIDLSVFDSKAGSAVLAFMAREARLREQAGDTLERIIDVLKVIRDEVMVVLTVDTLEYAWKSGRVGAIKAALSSILDIKPIIVLQDGVMEMTEMVRTRKKSLERVVLKIKGHFGDHPVRLAIVHAQDNVTAKKIEEMVLEILSVVEIVFTELSISVAANLGPGTVGIVALPAEL